MKSMKRLLPGIILIVAGILWILDLCEIITLNLFFDGWWTLFIIIPCTISLFTEREKFGSLFGILLGVGLLLAANDVITYKLFWKFLLPAILILIGLRLIFGTFRFDKAQNARQKLNEKLRETDGEIPEYCVTFSGMDVKFDDQTFYGANLTSVFGSIKCDLRNAVICDGAVITVSATFGGIELLLPDNTHIYVSASGIFGGVSDERSGKEQNQSENEVIPTIYIGGNCLFGGVTVK